jgi:phage gpG-like protein
MAFNFKTKIAKFKNNRKRLPVAIGAIAKTHFLGSFRNEGFTDQTLSPWAARTTKNKSDRRNKSRRAILADKGHLRRSIRVVRANYNRIEIGSTGIKYARFHNRGEGNQPKRQFVGGSAMLNLKIAKRIRKETKQIFR